MRTGLAIVAAAALLVGCSGPGDSPTPTVPATATTTAAATTTSAQPASPSPNATPSSTPTIDAAGHPQSQSATGQPTPQPPLPVNHAPVGPSVPPSGCTGLTWPQPIPRDLIGASAKEVITDALLCFTVAAIAPDGHDIMTDRANDLTPWVVTSVRPASGTPVGRDDVITIHVALKAG